MSKCFLSCGLILSEMFPLKLKFNEIHYFTQNKGALHLVAITGVRKKVSECDEP